MTSGLIFTDVSDRLLVAAGAVTYRFVCDATASPTAGPTEAIEGGIQGYTFVWPTAAACHPQPSSACPSVPDPKPSTGE